MSNSPVLIRNAAGMMTGLAGPAARTEARDLLIENGVISDLGRDLPAPPGTRVLDTPDCVV